MVFKARHKRLKRIVALKVLSPHRANDPDAVDRFHREMEALGRLSHPHIARATDAGEAGGYYYLAMEYVEGTDIARVLDSLGPMSLADACEIARQTGEALAFIHKHGMIHRDIKPSNLLLGRDGVVRVLDLGLVRLGEPGEGGDQLTITGTVMGTADFIAPEQARGSRNVDIRADVYSLGCTLYTLLTGCPPFTGAGFESAYEKFRAHNEATPPPVREKRPDVPETLAALIARMLEKDPSARPLTPAKVVLDLTPFCRGHDLARLASTPTSDPNEVPTPLPNLLPSPEQPAQPELTATHQGHTTARHGPAARTTTSRRTPLRKRRWVIATGLAGVLAGVVMAALLGSGPRLVDDPGDRPPDGFEAGRSTEPLSDRFPEVAPPPKALYGTRIFPPGEWVELLDRPTVKRVWPDRDDKAWLKPDLDKHELWVNCNGWGILELETIAAESFDLEATIYQHPWVGGVGIYFCGREEKVPGPVTVWGNFLLLQGQSTSPPESKPRLSVGQLRRFDSDGRFYPRYERGGELPLTFLEQRRGDHRLGVSIGPAGLTNVTWDDQPVAPGALGPLGGAVSGPIGLIGQDSPSLFRSVRVRTH